MNEVMSAADIAEYLGVCRRHVVARITKAAGFPKPEHRASVLLAFSRARAIFVQLGDSMGAKITMYLPWLLSAITIYMTLLAGNKNPNAWLVGLINQALWLVWVCVSGTWGLLPLTAVLTALYVRNHLKWGSK